VRRVVGIISLVELHSSRTICMQPPISTALRCQLPYSAFPYTVSPLPCTRLPLILRCHRSAVC
jgi:hypothetical protein